MTFLGILNNIKNKESKNKNDLVDFIECFEKNINLNIKYKYIEKVDSVLQNFKENKQQIEIIHKKFNNLKTRHELFDLLAEIIICYEYLSENPRFIKEDKKEKTPDLKTDNLVIEIKRIRNSDTQNKLIESLILENRNSEDISIYSRNLDINNQYQGDSLLLKKAQQKIDRSIKQIKDNHGMIYLIYNVDLSGFKLQKERENSLIEFAYDYFNKKAVEKIKLKVIDLNSLLFK